MFCIVNETQKMQKRIDITTPKFFLELHVQWLFLDVSHESYASTTSDERLTLW